MALRLANGSTISFKRCKPDAEIRGNSLNLTWECDVYEEGVDYEHLPLPDTCSKDPRAIHGFDRNGSHCENRFVCFCESQRFDKE